MSWDNSVWRGFHIGSNNVLGKAVAASGNGRIVVYSNQYPYHKVNLIIKQDTNNTSSWAQNSITTPRALQKLTWSLFLEHKRRWASCEL